jgi:hypothetical protein
MMIAADGSDVENEIEQIRHLLEVRGNVRIVAPQVHVVESDVDDMLDLTAGGLEVASRLRYAVGR